MHKCLLPSFSYYVLEMSSALYFPGVIPVIFLNIRIKALLSGNPTIWATSVTFILYPGSAGWNYGCALHKDNQLHCFGTVLYTSLTDKKAIYENVRQAYSG